MFQYFAFMTLLTITLSASVSTKKDVINFVPILKQAEEKTNDGSFIYYYESADGLKRQEAGIVKNAGTDDETLVVKGSWSYLDQNGKEVVVEYIADENGFQPQGTYIAPAIAQNAQESAQRSKLEKIVTNSTNKS